MGQALFGGNGKNPQVLKREEMNVKINEQSRNYIQIPVSF
jgi:hypothetical protein